MMGPREARLRAMIDQESSAWPELSTEDKDAIRWAFARIETLERELEESRQARFREMQTNTRSRDRVLGLASEIKSAYA